MSPLQGLSCTEGLAGCGFLGDIRVGEHVPGDSHPDTKLQGWAESARSGVLGNDHFWLSEHSDAIIFRVVFKLQRQNHLNTS